MLLCIMKIPVFYEQNLTFDFILPGIEVMTVDNRDDLTYDTNHDKEHTQVSRVGNHKMSMVGTMVPGGKEKINQSTESTCKTDVIDYIECNGLSLSLIITFNKGNLFESSKKRL